MHIPGEPPDLGLQKRGRAQLSRFCKAEYFWDVAEREGLTPFVINYPVGWPNSFKRGAMSLYSWPMPESPPGILAPSATYTYHRDSANTRYRIVKAERYPLGLSTRSPPLEVHIPVEGGSIEEPIYVRAMMLDSERKGYDTLALMVNGKLHIVKRDS